MCPVVRVEYYPGTLFSAGDASVRGQMRFARPDAADKHDVV